MKMLGSGQTCKRGNSEALDVLRLYLAMLIKAVVFSVVSIAFVAPVFMVFFMNMSPWFLIISVCTLLLVCAGNR